MKQDGPLSYFILLFLTKTCDDDDAFSQCALSCCNSLSGDLILFNVKQTLFNVASTMIPFSLFLGTLIGWFIHLFDYFSLIIHLFLFRFFDLLSLFVVLFNYFAISLFYLLVVSILNYFIGASLGHLN